MPEAHGLFQRAAMESGFGVTALTPEAATKMTRTILGALRLKDDQVDALQSMPVPRLLEALQKATGGLPFGIGPVVDGRSLPRHPFWPDAPEVSRNVPVLLGYNKTETTFLFPPPGAFDLDWPRLATQLGATLPGPRRGKDHCRLARTPSAGDAERSLFLHHHGSGHGPQRQHRRRSKSAQGGAPVFLYRLEWQTPIEGGRMRSPHSLDIPLIFDNVDKAERLIGTERQKHPASLRRDESRVARLRPQRHAKRRAFRAGLQIRCPDAGKHIFDVRSRAVNDPLRASARCFRRNLKAVEVVTALMRTSARHAAIGYPGPSPDSRCHASMTRRSGIGSGGV